MTICKFAAGLLLTAIAVPAAAQSIPDDVRCLALSNAFGKSASEESARQAASRALLFYIGRLDAQNNAEAVRAALQSVKIDPKTAPAEMTQCATRFADAVRSLETTVNPPAAPGR